MIRPFFTAVVACNVVLGLTVPATAQEPPRPGGAIRVQGNQFVDASGQPVVFRGLCFSDPDKLEKDGHWNTRYFDEAKSWGANIVRFAIHPRAWRERGRERYLGLDRLVLRSRLDADAHRGLGVHAHGAGGLLPGRAAGPAGAHGVSVTVRRERRHWRRAMRRGMISRGGPS